MAQTEKNMPAVRETQVESLGQEDSLEKEMATHSRNPAWRILWTEEPSSLQPMGLQRDEHDWVIETNNIVHQKISVFKKWEVKDLEFLQIQ